MNNKIFFDAIERDAVLSVSLENLTSAFSVIEADWGRHLKDNGIILPSPQTSKWFQLAILKHFEGMAVHKNYISELISIHTNKSATDQQVRHLKTQCGWHVLNRGDSYKIHNKYHYTPPSCHVLITTEKPSPNSTLQRRATVRKGDWDEILLTYDNKCASCGTKIGEFHRYDPSFRVEKLEQGHMNPRKPLVAGNIIPQCRWCNRTALSDFVFDEQGRVKSVASVRPVRRADPDVINEIKDWIKDGE